LFLRKRQEKASEQKAFRKKERVINNFRTGEERILLLFVLQDYF